MNQLGSAERALAFRREEGFAELAGFGIKSWILDRLTRGGSTLFFRGRDTISVRAQISGVWEPALTELIAHFARAGHGDFLIDIGANIGLVSCQSGNAFRAVHMFEPNPLCCHLIAVNAALALTVPHTLHPFGIGDRDTTCELTVPRHNWGGAFVDDAANAYDKSIIAAKDGFAAYSPDNYFKLGIEIRDGAAALGAVFAELAAAGLTRGVVKIDVEGYEPVVLAALARALPPEVSVAVAMECWDDDFAMEEALDRFGGRARGYKLDRRVPWKPGASRLEKALALALHPHVSTRILPGRAGDWRGDVVLMIDAAPEKTLAGGENSS